MLHCLFASSSEIFFSVRNDPCLVNTHAKKEKEKTKKKCVDVSAWNWSVGEAKHPGSSLNFKTIFLCCFVGLPLSLVLHTWGTLGKDSPKPCIPVFYRFCFLLIFCTLAWGSWLTALLLRGCWPRLVKFGISNVQGLGFGDTGRCSTIDSRRGSICRNNDKMIAK